MDGITIADWLKDKGLLDKVGGYDYLMQLQDSTLVSAHLKSYAEIVLENSLGRKIIESANTAIDRVYKKEDDVSTILNESRESLFAIGGDHTNKTRSNADVAGDVIEGWQDAANGKVSGLPWLIPDIGNVFGNFQDFGNPYFIAAEPGGGKSTVMQNQFTSWALFRSIPCGIASLEMTHRKLISRILAERADISAWAMDNAKYGDGSTDQLMERASRWLKRASKAKETISAMPLHIEDRPMNVDEFCAWGLMMMHRYGVRAIGLDYLQLMHAPDRMKLSGLEELSYVLGKLQNFTKRTGVILIVLSQITKLPINSDGQPRKPRQDDLYGGRMIDAHSEGTVIFYTRDGNDIAAICKNRNGGVGEVPVWFNRPRLRFEPLSMKQERQERR